MNPRLVLALFRKDLLLEWRQKYAFNGIVLYVFSTLFIIQLSFQRLNPGLWVTMFWIVVLFASVNAAAKSFLQEGRGRLLYYYTIAGPEEILVSKFLYNSLLLLTVALIGFFGFNILFGDAIQNDWYFLLIIFLGCTGFSACFTMVSAIASKASGSSTLMTILSFPVIIPQLLLLIKLSKRAADGFDLSVGWRDLVALGSINLIVVIISYLLFPYLWRD